MSTIRFQMIVLLTLFFGTTLGFSYMAFRSFRDYRDSRLQLELSYLIHDEVEDFSTLRPTTERMRLLKSYRAQLHPKRRLEELSSFIQALGSGNTHLLRERQKLLMRNEAEFRRYTIKQVTYQENKVLYYASLSLLVMFIGFISLHLFMQRSVIRPIKDLSRKMVDFLHDRYTYQFNVPAPDEIGHMQATFNSLAQRVISNVEELKTLDQAKSDFLSIASHELRTPLTSIKGSLSLMRSGVVGAMNEMAENLLTIAETETDRLIRLINDILDLAKIEAQKLPLHQEWHDWNKLVKTCLESLQGLAQTASVELVVEAMPPLEVYMDEDRIQQVVTNLVSNAIKFSPKGKTVLLRCELDETHRLVVEVHDQGRGIDPQDQELIFQKFRQATNANNPLVKGTGLGLAIARALVEQHDGEIGVRSTPGQGSTFFFILKEWRYAATMNTEVAAA
jgi:signal transduction histidine kinase